MGTRLPCLVPEQFGGRFLADLHFIHLTFLKQNVPLLCRLGQNPHAHGADLWFIFADESLAAFCKIKKMYMDKANFVLKRFHLQLIREKIRACSDNQVNDGQQTTLWTNGWSWILVPLHSVHIKPEMWVYSRMFELCQLCSESTVKKVGWVWDSGEFGSVQGGG